MANTTKTMPIFIDITLKKPKIWNFYSKIYLTK